MKSLIKMAVGVALLVACFNAGNAALNNYRFEDAVHEGLLYDVKASDAEITDMVMKLADQYDVPLDRRDIRIQDVNQDVRIDISYTRDIVLLPGIYSRPWTFQPSTSARILTGQRR